MCSLSPLIYHRKSEPHYPDTNTHLHLPPILLLFTHHRLLFDSTRVGKEGEGGNGGGRGGGRRTGKPTFCTKGFSLKNINWAKVFCVGGWDTHTHTQTHMHTQTHSNTHAHTHDVHTLTHTHTHTHTPLKASRKCRGDHCCCWARNFQESFFNASGFF